MFNVFFCVHFPATKAKIDFNLRLTLLSSAPWVQCGSFLDLCYSARSFVVKIDPTGLPPGVHTAQIRAYESGDIEKGTVFTVPITVVQPISLDDKINWNIHFDDAVCKPNTILRHFIQVPNNATWAGKKRMRKRISISVNLINFLCFSFYSCRM